jgi:hypothetical protein
MCERTVELIKKSIAQGVIVSSSLMANENPDSNITDELMLLASQNYEESVGEKNNQDSRGPAAEYEELHVSDVSGEKDNQYPDYHIISDAVG